MRARVDIKQVINVNKLASCPFVLRHEKHKEVNTGVLKRRRGRNSSSTLRLLKTSDDETKHNPTVIKLLLIYKRRESWILGLDHNSCVCNSKNTPQWNFFRRKSGFGTVSSKRQALRRTRHRVTQLTKQKIQEFPQICFPHTLEDVYSPRLALVSIQATV